MISAPVDYGLAPEHTLAHQVQGDLPEGFDNYWSGFREAVSTLPTRWRGTIDAPQNQVIMPSLDSVRIAGQLTMPARTPRGVVIATHGYDGAPETFLAAPESWTERGLATLQVRVRGYPPSTIDINDLRVQWILHRIESADAWILRGAVADVMQAFRTARVHFGPTMPIALQGESFGAGLAVIAAAQLTLLGDPPFRISLGLPSLGDWRWREGKFCNGAGGQVNMLLDASRGAQREDLLRTLLLFDAAFHTRTVTAPCLCKLATRDDTVPAPSAAAVFNALASRRKWPFITQYGHFDGGLADLRRHALFERLNTQFLDPDSEFDQVVGETSPSLDRSVSG